jgi:hypothetical protein
MTTIETQALRKKLSQGYKKQGVHYLDKIEEKIDKSLHIIWEKNNSKKYHTIDYPSKKAQQYKMKYDIDIHQYAYPVAEHTINSIKNHLNIENHKPVGFYIYSDSDQSHVDAFIIHNNKILILKTSAASNKIVGIIKKKFPNDTIYVQKKIDFYYSPQQDYVSCPAFALKYLKECLRDNAKMLSMIHFIPSDNIDTTHNEFIIHPYIERYSQSNTYFNKAKEIWQENHTSEESNALISKADAWRKTHDKSRMVYYLLKDLDTKMGYDELDTVKKDIINHKDDNDTHSDDEDNFF